MYRIIGADGKEYGPISADGLRQWISEGRANGATQVLVANSTEWKLLRDLPEFRLPAPGPIQQPVGTPGIIVVPEERRTNPLATTGFVLALFSATFGLCCCGGFPLNLIGAVCSGLALSQIKDNPNQDGYGLALAGLIISILSMLVGGALFIISSIISSLGGVLQNLRNL